MFFCSLFLNRNSPIHAEPKQSSRWVEAHETATPLFLIAVALFFISSMALVLIFRSKGLSRHMKMAGRILAGILAFSIAFPLVTMGVDTYDMFMNFEKTKGKILDRRYYLRSSTTGRSWKTISAVPIAAVSYSFNLADYPTKLMNFPEEEIEKNFARFRHFIQQTSFKRINRISTFLLPTLVTWIPSISWLLFLKPPRENGEIRSDIDYSGKAGSFYADKIEELIVSSGKPVIAIGKSALQSLFI